MTKDELELRALFLEKRLDNDAFYSEDEEIEAEKELCQIYKMLNRMYELEAE